jgi:hypothetical protein
MMAKRHPLFDAGLRKLIDRFVHAWPKPDYTIPKEGVRTGCYGLPDSGDIYAEIARTIRPGYGPRDRKIGMDAALGLCYGTGKPEMVHTYMGVNVEDMDRRQLIDAVVFLGTQLREANASAAQLCTVSARWLRDR